MKAAKELLRVFDFMIDHYVKTRRRFPKKEYESTIALANITAAKHWVENLMNRLDYIEFVVTTRNTVKLVSITCDNPNMLGDMPKDVMQTIVICIKQFQDKQPFTVLPPLLAYFQIFCQQSTALANAIRNDSLSDTKAIIEVMKLGQRETSSPYPTDSRTSILSN